MPHIATRVDVQVSPDALFTQYLFKKSHALTDASLVAQVSAPTRTIAHLGEEALPMGDIATGKILFIQSTRQVVVKITSAEGSAQALICGASAALGGSLYLEGNYTAVSIENKSGQSADVTAFLGGA